MSGTTLPTLCSTSSAADLQPPQSPTPNSSESDVYPFLVHSQHSITTGESTEVENRNIVRQKRKRTSPEDQATLEAEYKRNPKPDKAARVEILKRVSLGEKEIQIWFQNRRQNTRRKSRPLLPHEIAAFGLGGMMALSPASVRSITHGNSGGSAPPFSRDAVEMNNPNLGCSQISDNSHELECVPASPILREVQDPINEIPKIVAPSSKPMQTRTDSQTDTYTHSIGPLELSKSSLPSDQSPMSLGYLSNRRNARASSLNTPLSSAIPALTANSVSDHSPLSCPERVRAEKVSPPSSSQVRLSLSLDGKAELVSSQVSPQRPHRPQALSSSSDMSQIRPSLKRCQSNVLSRQTLHKPFAQLSNIPRISNGRSQDARTWQFCCDTSARDALTTQAENESSGSAVAAISLLRSTSTINSKSNGTPKSVSASRLESEVLGKKPKLSRASSSLARLQGGNKALLGSPSGDSDKENWLPQDGPGNFQQRNLAPPRPQKQKRRRVLEEPKNGPILISVLDDHKKLCGKSAFTGVDIFEDPMIKPNGDEEVNKFMRGEVSPSKKGDLDCIQGLLSLSQGTWQ